MTDMKGKNEKHSKDCPNRLDIEAININKTGITYLIKIDSKLSSKELTQSIQEQINEVYNLGYRKVIFPSNSDIEIIDEYDGVKSNDKHKPKLLKLKTRTDYDLNGSTIRVKTNNYRGYNVFSMILLENTIIHDGIIIGDKDTHIFDEENSHEWGCGIEFAGTKNCRVENIEIYNMTGDGSYIGRLLSYYSTNIQQNEMVVGKIDNNGN